MPTPSYRAATPEGPFGCLAAAEILGIGDVLDRDIEGYITNNMILGFVHFNGAIHGETIWK